MEKYLELNTVQGREMTISSGHQLIGFRFSRVLCKQGNAIFARRITFNYAQVPLTFKKCLNFPSIL